MYVCYCFLFLLMLSRRNHSQSLFGCSKTRKKKTAKIARTRVRERKGTIRSVYKWHLPLFSTVNDIDILINWLSFEDLYLRFWIKERALLKLNSRKYPIWLTVCENTNHNSILIRRKCHVPNMYIFIAWVENVLAELWMCFPTLAAYCLVWFIRFIWCCNKHYTINNTISTEFWKLYQSVAFAEKCWHFLFNFRQ